jgi:hypothetical protein
MLLFKSLRESRVMEVAELSGNFGVFAGDGDHLELETGGEDIQDVGVYCPG